jgi:hypothetical protein
VGKKDDKKKQALLEEQQRADRARMDAYMAQAAAPKPLETALDKQSLDWINQTSGENGPLDITSLSAMKPNLALYDNASRRQSGERMGLGALQLGAQGSNPMLSQLLRSQQDDQRQQDAAGGLENAYRMTDASMRGNIMPLLGLQQNRTMGLAGMASGNSANSTNAWSNFRPAPSFWSQLLMGGLGAGAQLGSAYIGRDRR